MHCLQCFSTEEILTKHNVNGLVINGEQAVKMPKKSSKVQFQNFHKQMQVPLVIYADFETMTEKVDNDQPDENKSYTNTGCPISSFLYFISLYFSTIGLGKQIISTKVVSFNIIHYF